MADMRLLLLLLAAGLLITFSIQPDSARAEPLGREIDRLLTHSTDDPIAKDKRAIRVLVTYNATNYFVVSGQQRGLEYELMQGFEKMLNKDHKRAEDKRHMIYIAVPFDELIPGLLAGKGDIIAAGLTITPERATRVAFTRPYRENVAEVVVRAGHAPPLDGIEQLAGRTVHVLRGSSYAQHLKRLNTKLKQAKLKPVKIVEEETGLTSEDILQMVNAGIYQYTVVDDHIATLWEKLLDNIVVEDDIRVYKGSKIAWAVRKDNKQLLDKLDQYVGKHRQGTLLGNILFNRYYKDTKWIVNPVSDSTMKRLQQYQAAFQKYGEKYNIDWIILTAQGFQESRLDQNKRSISGATGVMQIKPSTAADRNVGIEGVGKDADRNIHAAVKYMAFIRKRYFSDPAISPIDQVIFTLAAYNAGPARIASMRKRTREAGLDPNVWFGNVEHITSKYVGSEPVNYVANIIKYYIAFKSTIESETRRIQAAESLR